MAISGPTGRTSAPRAYIVVEGSQRTEHLDALGDDVLAVAAINCADGHYRGHVGNVELTTDDGLQAVDDLRRGGNRIDTGA